MAVISSSRGGSLPKILLSTLALGLAVLPVHAAAPAGDWYLKAGAIGDGKSVSNPIGSAAVIEQLGREGETIVLLPGSHALDGGIALRAGQSLIGFSDSGRKPVITNTDASRNGGCGIVLAEDNRIQNLRVENTHASGVYGPHSPSARIDGVDVHGANLAQSFLRVSYSTLPGSLPHGGMVFVHSRPSNSSKNAISISSSQVRDANGFGIASITSGSSASSLAVVQTRVDGGSRIGFFDAGISMLVQDSGASAQLSITESEVQGRLSRAGRNVMVVASGGALADARVEGFLSGPTGQDGIVGAVMQSPSQISISIVDSLVEGAGQMNVEGSLINLPPLENAQADLARVSIDIKRSTIRNAGAVSGFENVAANVWLGPSQFLEDQPLARGTYKLRITDSRIEGAGRSGLEFGDWELLDSGKTDYSEYDVVLRRNTIVNNGDAEFMIYAAGATIDARKNCTGPTREIDEYRVVVVPPAAISQLDLTEPILCENVDD